MSSVSPESIPYPLRGSTSAPIKLTMESHVALLHPYPRHGTIFFRSPDESGQGHQRIPKDSLALLPERWSGGDEHFVFPNEFGWAAESHLKSLTCCFIDIDHVTDPEIALRALCAAGAPHPSMIVHSGSGMHFYWLTQPAPAKALIGWQRVQDRLHEITEDLLPAFEQDGVLKRRGSDPTSKSCVKNLRLVGSKTKSGAEVTGLLYDDRRYSLRELEKLLGIPRPKDFPKPSPKSSSKPTKLDKRLAKKLPDDPTARAGGKSRSDSRLLIGENLPRWQREYWNSAVADIDAIAYACGYIPESFRDITLFLRTCCQAWLIHPDFLYHNAVEFSRWRMADYEKEIGSTLNSVIGRARNSAAGELEEFEGRRVDPRYRHSAETLYKLLKPLIERLPNLRLRVIISEEERALRKKQGRLCQDSRRKQEREKNGERAKYLSEEHLHSKQMSQRAGQLRQAGLTQIEIAAKLGCSKATVSRALKRFVETLSAGSAPLYDPTQPQPLNAAAGVSAARSRRRRKRVLAQVGGRFQ